MANVEFFKTTGEAVLRGYRPCKVCAPLEKIGETPAHISLLLKELGADPSLRLRDGDLRNRGIEPATIRRWFLKNHGITFHAYQRMFRINSAFKRLKRGAPATATAFDAGYESLSGFNDSFKTIFGFSPSGTKDRRVIDLTRLETPLGTMIACAVDEGVCLLEFGDRRMLETGLKVLARRMNATIVQGSNEHFEPLQKELERYFAGTLKEFSVPLHFPGTPFQQSVWKELQRIPYGTTRSYKEQAIGLGQPSAVRAVANANGTNRIALIIPCHRVIGDDGQLTGYGGGLWRKQWLLDHEKEHSLT